MTFNYAARDYDTIKTDLLARAERVLPEWTDRDPSDFGMLFVDLWAMMGDVMHFYADAAAREAFLETATQRESVLAIANLFDYKPIGRASANGSVRVVNEAVTDYVVEKDTEFIAINNETTYTLHAQETVTVPAQSFLDVPIGEGEIVEDEVLTDSATGRPGQRYVLKDNGAATGTVRIDVYEDGVNAVPYEYVSNLSNASAGSRVFSTNISADGSIEVTFGNSVNGFVPPTGATVTSTYASCSGESGNLPTNSAVAFSVAPSTPGVKVDPVDSSTALAGGRDAESITSMKESIPAAISTQQRTVTYNDFVAAAKAVPGVAKATIEFTQGAGTADNVVTLYLQPTRSDYLTTADVQQAVDIDLRNTVTAEIQQRALLGVDVQASATVDWQEIDLEATVYVNRKAVTNTVNAAVNAALDELFAFDNVKFGQLLHLGQIHRIVLNVPGVDYVEVTKFCLAGGATVENDITIDPLELPKKGTYALVFSGGISTSV